MPNEHPKVPAQAPVKPKTIDEYIAGFSSDIQKTLNELWRLIQSEVPEAAEKIAYGMPTFYLKGNLVHFAAFKDHYGFFPAPSGIDAFEKELLPYRTGKGTLRFPLHQPFPWEIIKKIVRFRADENIKKSKKDI
ncbi:MAG: hypothetical protein EZS26_000136 [Candidatus Ordinivivax streblomastigis]|uniref:YdhG-like domain-containing protein n=1 Tax=Candidatus Ordinivivax streblomastigis TaxID=2540710 RepID=A0A5M8P4Y5_9BACT|nr:MAG: hypothetical protein EZS26_000136 [Candidatus Ordinivivax streblomastigis]